MLDPAALRRRLLMAVATIAALGLAAELVQHDVLVPKLSLSYEGNLPTWFASSLLLVCAITAGGIAAQRPPLRWHWWGISLVAGWMSLDEAAELHEHLGGLVGGTRGVLYYDWVIPATAIILALAILYVPFVRTLAAATRMRLVIAAAIYICGGLVMELPLGWWVDTYDTTDGLGYMLIDWVEETLELVGASLALVALVRHRQEHT